jgi:hypothetical protein
MDTKPLRIYSTDDVPRLRYIAGILLGDILGLTWEVITDKRKLGKHPVINYSDERITGAFKISPDTLLFETGVVPKEIIVTEWKGLPSFFPTTSDSDLPFDIFAASFYLVSRYEEYLVYESDSHGRFPASSSLASKNGFLQKPVVDLWAKELSKALLKKAPSLTFCRNQFRSLVTFDTDQPFAYLGKGLLRSIGGLLTDITGNTGHATERYRTVTKGDKDPFEVFDYITGCIEKSKSAASFFFPVGELSKFDKNPSWKNELYRELILKLSDKYNYGLHPSYYATDNAQVLKTEAGRLRSILGKVFCASRFHYIRLFSPSSYRNLCTAGITEDYSMGYPEEPGFRASIARPYYFFDILEENQTNLQIIPFQIMDATLIDYLKHSPEEAKEVILKVINETKKAGGIFVSIWHNTSLQENSEWAGWRDVFEFMIKNQAV